MVVGVLQGSLGWGYHDTQTLSVQVNSRVHWPKRFERSSIGCMRNIILKQAKSKDGQSKVSHTNVQFNMTRCTIQKNLRCIHTCFVCRHQGRQWLREKQGVGAHKPRAGHTPSRRKHRAPQGWPQVHWGHQDHWLPLEKIYYWLKLRTYIKSL